MDGVVGPHTWAKLLEKQQATITILAAQELKLTPPTFPSLPGMFLPPSPIAMHVPKLTLDNFQRQIGEQVTIPFSGPVTSAHSVQIVGVILNKNDKENVHLEGQFGFVTNFNQASRGDSKTDFEFLAVLNLANLPGSGRFFNWSVQAQLGLIKSLSNSSGSVQLTPLASANLSLIPGKK